jgi:hypothetical protein
VEIGFSEGEGRRGEDCGAWEEALLGVWAEGDPAAANPRLQQFDQLVDRKLNIAEDRT